MGLPPAPSKRASAVSPPSKVDDGAGRAAGRDMARERPSMCEEPWALTSVTGGAEDDDCDLKASCGGLTSAVTPVDVERAAAWGVS